MKGAGVLLALGTVANGAIHRWYVDCSVGKGEALVTLRAADSGCAMD
jgi:hypothetical protein